MSAQVLAAGLFPPGEDEVWNKEIPWQPVPIHTRPLSQEQLLAWKIPCPRFIFFFQQYQSSAEYKSIFSQYKTTIKNWERHSGQSLDKLADIMYLYDTLIVENRKGFVLDDWAKEALLDSTLEYLAAFHLQSFTHSTELKKLEAGYVIKEMLDRFRNKTESRLEPNRSLWIYAAHDLTIVNILNALNLYRVITYFSLQIFVTPIYSNSLFTTISRFTFHHMPRVCILNCIDRMQQNTMCSYSIEMKIKKSLNH